MGWDDGMAKKNGKRDKRREERERPEAKRLRDWRMETAGRPWVVRDSISE